MSREVEYGIRITARDELTAPAGRASKAASDLASALDGVEKSAGDVGGALSDQVSPAAKETASAIEDLTKKLGRLPGLNEKWSASVRGAQDAIQRMIAAGNVGDVGAALGGFNPDAVEEAIRRVGLAHAQAERDRTRATEIESAKRAAVEQAAMSHVAGLEGPAAPSMMQRALGSVSIGGLATGFAAVAASIAAATFAVQRFGAGMLDAAAAASEAEQAERRAIATIRLHGEFSDRQFEALKRNNLERQRQLGIDADLQAQMQGTLSAMGVQAGALDRATQAAIGLSRATGLGLTEASRAVAKALGGHVEALREYGIRVDSVAEAEARMADMFRASEAQSGTYGVAVSALSAAWGDLIEAIGELITKSPQVMTTINAIIGGVESMTDSMAHGGKTAKGLGQIVTTTFQLIGTSAQATASLISNMIGALNFVWRSPNLMRLSRDLDKSIVEMQNIMSGGTGREAESITQQAAAEYLEALKAAEFYRRELSNIDTTQEGAVDAILATNAALAEQEGKLRALQEWASKSTLGMRGLIDAAEDLAREEVDATRERRSGGAPARATMGAATARAPAPFMPHGPGREELEAFKQQQKEIDRHLEEAARAKKESDARMVREFEKNEQAKLEAARTRIAAQQKMEQEAARIAEDSANYLRGRLEAVGMAIVDAFSNAFSIVGTLQNKTVTEIVRNDEGMLEERTRITEQYIATTGDALKAFFEDVAGIVYRAAIHEIAVIGVRAAVEVIAREVGNWGLAGLVTGAIAAGAVVAAINAQKSAVPPPPQFFVGGRVPGGLGAPTLAMLHGGEQVTSVADRIDRNGGSNASVTVNNQVLVVPSRVQMERANRDAILPSMRRLSRYGSG